MMHAYAVALVRTGTADRVEFNRQIKAPRPADAIALVQQEAVRVHPDCTYEFARCERVFEAEVEVPA